MMEAWEEELPAKVKKNKSLLTDNKEGSVKSKMSARLPRGLSLRVGDACEKLFVMGEWRVRCECQLCVGGSQCWQQSCG